MSYTRTINKEQNKGQLVRTREINMKGRYGGRGAGRQVEAMERN